MNQEPSVSEIDDLPRPELPRLHAWVRTIGGRMCNAIAQNGFHGFAMPENVRRELKEILGTDAKMCQLTRDCVKVHGRIVLLLADVFPHVQAGKKNQTTEAA